MTPPPKKMDRQRGYVGLEEDRYGGMTAIGGLFKDAQVFGLIPETETGKGWSLAQVQRLHDQVGAEWDKYGLRVGNLPEALRARHARIHAAAIARAQALGWEPGLDVDSAMQSSTEPVLPS
jgi:hypothetical protein